MTISQIYQKYQIPPNLQRHMLEVTAVGRYIVDHWTGPSVSKGQVTESLLLHDMGNIIKFRTPFLGELEENADYWLTIRQSYIKKYGTDVHRATETIIKEILPKHTQVITNLQAMGFQTIEIKGYQSWLARICDHADMCVAPFGITTFSQRILDLQQRYGKTTADRAIQLRNENAQIIQNHVSVDLEQLPNQDFSQEIEGLKNYMFTSSPD